jgi:hypothetical protein
VAGLPVNTHSIPPGDREHRAEQRPNDPRPDPSADWRARSAFYLGSEASGGRLASLRSRTLCERGAIDTLIHPAAADRSPDRENASTVTRRFFSSAGVLVCPLRVIAEVDHGADGALPVET